MRRERRQVDLALAVCSPKHGLEKIPDALVADHVFAIESAELVRHDVFVWEFVARSERCDSCATDCLERLHASEPPFTPLLTRRLYAPPEVVSDRPTGY